MMRVVQGGPWHGLRFTGRKKTSHRSRISKFHFHKNKQITYSFFFCSYARKSGKEELFKESKIEKDERKAACSKLHTFIILDRQLYPFVLYV